MTSESLLPRFATAALALFPLLGSGEEIGEIDFNRDIRPILSDNCYHCHGPDAQNQRSDFRIDSREEALREHNGFAGIVPGSLEDSEVNFRIHLPSDDIESMPPPDSNRSLSEPEKKLLDAWILQGAEYDKHWSFKIPEKKDLPETEVELGSSESGNEIDAFIEKRLEEENLTPQPKADLETRLRRASLSLTGMLPDAEKREAALNDGSEVAYENFVDELLASKNYAERQTLRWLDAARYADTDGYQKDDERTNWPWRDWVINAHHENMPFDQFTIEQLAGDMIPDASSEQVLASAFNRNHRQNSEGGALAEEFFVENVIDRVETTSTVWLGLTMGCARCHDHKYDPVTQLEFFQLYAFFNNIGEKGIGRGTEANPVDYFTSPLHDVPQELIDAHERAMKNKAEAERGLGKRQKEWFQQLEKPAEELSLSWSEVSQFYLADVVGQEGSLELQEDGSLLYGGENNSKPVYEVAFQAQVEGKISAIQLTALTHETFSGPRKLSRSSNGNFVLTDFIVAVVDSVSGESRPVEIGSVTASFEQSGYPIRAAIDDKPESGWAVSGGKGLDDMVTATFVLSDPVLLGETESLKLRLAHESRFGRHNIGRFKVAVSNSAITTSPAAPEISEAVLKVLEISEAKRSSREKRTLSDFYRKIDEPLLEAQRDLRNAEKALAELGSKRVPVMVMREREGDPEPAFLLDRGAYDAPDHDQPAPRAVPAAVFYGEEQEMPGDRLELAQWIVSAENPLTARVIVNRIWRDHFGVGLVKTVEDFGLQSELPSHPALLDWLAVEFIESGWDLKALHRLIVTSDAFQRKSYVDPQTLDADPENRLLARGPRYRLDGFVIRDIALQASGLLNAEVGGPPVKPYQPEGLWSSIAGRTGIKYEPGSGGDLYRKSLYTYWKRAVNPPRQLIFDAGGREACSVSVKTTNTPLQALALMNDPTFVEAARHAAEEVILAEKNEAERLADLYQRVTSLAPSERQLKVLRDSLTFYQGHFAERPAEATSFLSVGASTRNESIDPVEHAAWSAIAHLLFNLDTSITLQ